MKVSLTFFIIVFPSILLFSQDNLTLNYNEAPLEKVLNDLEEVTEIKFIYKDEIIQNKKITCSIKNSKAEKALTEILKNSDISYRIFNKNKFVLFREDKPVPGKKLTPVVTNDDFIIRDTSFTFTKPKMISKISPVYPIDAIKKNIEGKVTLRFLVNKEGSVSLTILDSTSGSSILDSAALSYVQSLKFIPANANGDPRNIWMNMKFNYYFKE